MKLLYVVSGQSYSSSRPSRKIAALVRCWREMGHEVELICGNDVLPAGRQASVQRYQANQAAPPWYRQTPWLQPLVNTVSEWANIRHDRRLAAVVSDRIRSFQPDLYVQRSSRIDARTLNEARRAGIPTVLEWKDNIVVSPAARQSIGRGDLYGWSFLKPYARRVERWKEAHADWLIVESEVLRERLARHLGRDPQSIVVALNAVNIADFPAGEVSQADARQQLGLPENSFLAVFVGSFNWYQHVEYLIRAIGSPLCPESVHAVLVGDGPNRPGCESLVRKLNLNDRVHFVGRVPHDQVPRYLAAADTAILPDCTEIITPIKVQEYMAMGIPPLVPDYRANREVLEDGVTGILFQPRDVEALARQLARLQQDPLQRDRIGAAARQAVAERLSWPATWGRAVESILEQSRKTTAR